MKNVAIFASGSGSNAETICNYFSNSKEVNIKIILTNKKDALVIDRANRLNIPVIWFSRDMFYNSSYIPDMLKMNNIDLVVLAGFLWLIPGNLIQQFPNKIINIHPALLPKYGGKGMYGNKVHESVVANKECESGITIHFVNEEYDKGNILLQVKCPVTPEDSAETVAQKVHSLEYAHYPKVIEKLLSK